MIMKHLKAFILAVTAVVLIAAVCAGCTFTGTAEDKWQKESVGDTADTADNNSATEIGIVMDGIDVPDTVLEAAREKVGQSFEDMRAYFTDYGYVNWRIEALTYSYTYDDLDGMKLVIYQMNYEFLSESPENIVLAGGMYITEDNWVMPGYPDCTYLIFRQEGDTLVFLKSIIENDCSPGTQLFTEDLRQILSLSEEE